MAQNIIYVVLEKDYRSLTLLNDCHVILWSSPAVFLYFSIFSLL